MGYLGILLLLFFGCSPTRPKDFFGEGEAKCRSLIYTLERIESREELLEAEGVLKKKFQGLASLIASAETYLDSHPNAVPLGTNAHNDDLLYELGRILEIPGCRDVLEKIQSEALMTLDQKSVQRGTSGFQ